MSRVEKVLSKLGLEARLNAGRWWTRTCPMPRHKTHNAAHEFQNFFVRADDSHEPGVWHCYSCKAGGKTIVGLVAILRQISYREALLWVRAIEDAEPPAPFLRVRFEDKDVRSFRLPLGVEHEPLECWNTVAREYAVSRGITADQVQRHRIGYALMGKLSGRIVFPVFDGRGKLANYTGRTFVGDPVRYMSASKWEEPDLSVFWGEHLWPPIEKRRVLVLFEGAINGMAIERALPVGDVYLGGLFGSNFEEGKALKLGAWRRIVVATDPDAAGDEVFRDIVAGIRTSKARVERFEYPGRVQADREPKLREALAACLALA